MRTSKQTRTQELLRVLGISGIEWIAGFAVLALLTLRAFLDVYLQNTVIAQKVDSWQESISGFISTVTEKPIFTDITTFVLWGVIGLIVYTLVWSIVVIIRDVLNDVIIANYFVHPSSYHKSSFWLAALSRRIMVITFAVVIALYCILLLRCTPYVYESIHSLFLNNSGDLGANIIIATVNVLTWFAGWHLVVVIRRISVLVDQKINS